MEDIGVEVMFNPYIYLPPEVVVKKVKNSCKKSEKEC